MAGLRQADAPDQLALGIEDVGLLLSEDGFGADHEHPLAAHHGQERVVRKRRPDSRDSIEYVAFAVDARDLHDVWATELDIHVIAAVPGERAVVPSERPAVWRRDAAVARDFGDPRTS